MTQSETRSPIRVLHVISGIDPRAGGPVAVIAGLAPALAQAGLEITVFSTWGKGDSLIIREQLAHAGVNVQLLGPVSLALNGWHVDLAARLRQLIAEADVVHIHALWEQVQHRAARIAQELGKPYIMTPHGMLDPWSFSQHHFKKQLYMALRLRRNLCLASAVYYTCEDERELAAPLNIGTPAIIETLGLNLTEFRELPPKGFLRSRYPQLVQRPIVIFLARLHPKKGLELLIPAFAKAFPENGENSPALVIAGPSSENYQEKLEKLTREHGIAERTIFTGMLYGADRIAAMVDADLFALTSYQENFGVAVVESLAAGTPVLISDKVNIHREITTAKAGASVPLDIPTITEQLKYWITNPELRQQTGQRARQWALASFDWHKIAQHWVSYYATLCLPEKRTTAPQDSPLSTRQKHVLHVISSLDPAAGGPVSALFGLVKAQVHQGIRVSVVTTWRKQEKKSLAREFEALGVQVTRIGPAWTRSQWHHLTPDILRLLIRRTDIVHIHALWEDIQHQSAKLARKLGKPYIVRPCGMLDPWSLAQHEIRKRFYMDFRLRKDLNLSSNLHFTAELERDLTKNLHLKTPSLVIPNGIDLDEFRELPARGTFRAKYSQIGKRPMILFLSRINPKKGLDILIPAFAEVLRQIRESSQATPQGDTTTLTGTQLPVLVIAGTDSDGYEKTIRQMAVTHGIKENVIFTGPIYGEDKIAAYTDADLFCLPSYQENFGNVVIEALAAKCPVLISDQVNIWREVAKSQSGWVQPTRVMNFATEIRRLLQTPEELTRAGERGRSFVLAGYDWDLIASQWNKEYERILT